MTRFLALTAIASACVVTLWQTNWDTGDDRWAQELVQSLDLEDVRQTCRRLDEEIAKRARFAEYLGQLLARLEAGSMSLAEASEDCLRTARETYPFYLEALSLVQAGDSVREQVARNLVQYFHVWAKETDPQVLPRLASELQLLCVPQ